MQRERCDNCNAPVVNVDFDELFKRCTYCENALERKNNSIMTNIITVEEIYYNEIISGHRLYVGINMKNDYEFLKLSNKEIDDRIDTLINKLFDYYKTLDNNSEKKNIIKAINNIYDTFY